MDDLGTVLALLHGAPSRVRRLRAEIVSRVDSALSRKAFERSAEGHVTVYAYAEDDDEEPEPAEVTFRARVWADRERRWERAEREGMHEELAVRRGGTWWRWDRHNGAITNEGDDHATTTVAEELAWLLGGIRLVALLELTAIDRGAVAGRPTWRCRAVPSADDDHDRFDLHRLPGYGADEYELDVDAQTGIVLRVAGRLDGEVFSEHEVVDLGVDEELPDELFEFTSPDGTPPRSLEEAHGEHHMHVSPRRLIELADFPLFTPRRMPEAWHAMLGYHDGVAIMHLRAEDGLHSVAINQAPQGTDDLGWDHANPAPWQHVTHDGIEYQWREPNEDWQPARVRFVREGTRVTVDSAEHSAVELLELARTMVPLRDDAPDFGGSDEPADER